MYPSQCWHRRRNRVPSGTNSSHPTYRRLAVRRIGLFKKDPSPYRTQHSQTRTASSKRIDDRASGIDPLRRSRTRLAAAALRSRRRSLVDLSAAWMGNHAHLLSGSADGHECPSYVRDRHAAELSGLSSYAHSPIWFTITLCFGAAEPDRGRRPGRPFQKQSADRVRRRTAQHAPAIDRAGHQRM